MPKYVDITGKRFGRLEVLGYAGNNKHGSALWRCKCDCGKETVVIGAMLRNGNTKSCGCMGLEKLKMGWKFQKHGGAGTRIYVIWRNMRQRCNNPKSPYYKYYGGRGISICNEWDDFSVFEDWSLSNGYADNLTIDRINVDGNYEPSNCRWVGIKEQAANKQNTRRIGGKTIKDISRESGACYETLLKRQNGGWKDEDITKVPIGKAMNKKEVIKVMYDGEYYNVHELSEKTGVPVITLYRKIRNGLSGKELVTDFRKNKRVVCND